MYIPSDEQIINEAYLISRGVRSLALLGTVPNDQACEIYLKLSELASTKLGSGQAAEPVPFLSNSAEGDFKYFGYAARKWVIETFEWLNTVEEPHYSRILGMLLGYSPLAIAEYDEIGSGNLGQPHVD